MRHLGGRAVVAAAVLAVSLTLAGSPTGSASIQADLDDWVYDFTVHVKTRNITPDTVTWEEELTIRFVDSSASESGGTWQADYRRDWVSPPEWCPGSRDEMHSVATGSGTYGVAAIQQMTNHSWFGLDPAKQYTGVLPLFGGVLVGTETRSLCGSETTTVPFERDIGNQGLGAEPLILEGTVEELAALPQDTVVARTIAFIRDQPSTPGVALDGNLSYSATKTGPPVVREPRDACEGVTVPARLNAVPATASDSRKVRFSIGPFVAGNTYSLQRRTGGAWQRVQPGSHTYDYPVAGNYKATLLVTTPAGCTATASDSFTAGAVTAYAPTIYFHPRERFFPDAAQTFLARSQLIHWRPKQCGGPRYVAAGAEARRVGGVKQPLLRAAYLSGKGGRVYAGPKKKAVLGRCATRAGTARANGNPQHEFIRRETTKFKHSSGFYLNMLNAPTGWRQGSLRRARIYYLYKHEAYIAYWIFYPYNRWQRARVTEIHEGDWEHYVVRLGEDNVATQSAFYQHNCKPVVRTWRQTHKEGGTTHPLLFPALGGHASYNLAASAVGSNRSLRNCSIPQTNASLVWSDAVGKGKAWRPWRSGQLTRASNHAWFGFGGTWGDRSSQSSNLPGVDNYGPPAPGPFNRGVPKSWL